MGASRSGLKSWESAVQLLRIVAAIAYERILTNTDRDLDKCIFRAKRTDDWSALILIWTV